MAGRVIKKTQVRMTGSRSLAAPAHDVQQPCETHCGQSTAAARIVDAGPDGALIEITCSCGQVSYVRCDYAPQ